MPSFVTPRIDGRVHVMSIAAMLVLIGGGLGMSGIATTAAEFDPNQPWFYLGLTGISASVMTVLSGVLLSRRTRIVRAFDVGFQAGYAKGRRAGRPRVIPFDRRNGT